MHEALNNSKTTCLLLLLIYAPIIGPICQALLNNNKSKREKDDLTCASSYTLNLHVIIGFSNIFQHMNHRQFLSLFIKELQQLYCYNTEKNIKHSPLWKMGIQRNSPKVSPKRTLKFLLDLDSKYNSSRQPHTNSVYEEILSLIPYCSYIYTFTDPSESPSQQNFKRDKLINLLAIIKPLKKPIPDEILSPLFTMISTNLFRPLPPPHTTCIVSILPDDDELVATPTAAWPHLHIIYDILLRLVFNLEPKSLCEYIDESFIQNLLALFRSEDPRERESLKNAYHKIYAKFHSTRSFMRKAMNDVFLHYIFETEEKHCGVGDLLEIWGTIINGFSIPLKEEHKLFLMRVLIPLHRPKGMQAYHQQLAYCVYQFVEKEPMLGVVVVQGILRYWPVTNCQKEVLLIGELEALVESMGLEEYKILALPLCTRITKCLNSWNSQVINISFSSGSL